MSDGSGSSSVNLPESSSIENPPIDYTFELEMKPLWKLRLALEALLDSRFNKDGFGMISVDDQGFKILVQNANKDVAFLRLHPSGKNMISYRSYQPMRGSLVHLGVISENLPALPDGDDVTVSISHVHGSTQLCFMLRTAPLTEFAAEFIVNPQLGPISLATVYCAAIVPTKDLRQMIDCRLNMDNPNSKTVIVYMRKNFARFSIVNTRQWDYGFTKDEVNVTRGFHVGHIQRAEFEFNYATFLYKASFLQNESIFYYLTVPDKHIMFQFRMLELGELTITQAAVSMEAEVHPRTEAERNRNTLCF